MKRLCAFLARHAEPLLYVYTLLMLLIVGWVGESLYYDRFLAQTRNTVSGQLANFSGLLTQALNFDAQLLIGLGAHIQNEPSFQNEHFQEMASALARGRPEVEQIAFIRRDAEPYVFSAQSINRDLSATQKLISKSIELAHWTSSANRPIALGPDALIEGTPYVFLNDPIYKDDPQTGKSEYLGTIALTVNLNSVFLQAGLSDADLGLKLAARNVGSQGVDFR